MNSEPRLKYVLVARSGSGKSTMASILESRLGLHRCVTSTTRPLRAGEEDGRDYHFLTEMDRSRMFESARFGDYWYGTEWTELQKSDFIILDPQGVAYFRKHYPSPLTVIQLERDGIKVDAARMARDKDAGFDDVHPDYTVRGETVEEMSGNLLSLFRELQHKANHTQGETIMAKKRLFVDMDGTLARFHDQVNYLERMFEKDFFRDLEPFENMVEGIRRFIKDHPDVEVYILSAKVVGEPPYCEVEKHIWMDMHLPEIPRERRIFTEMGRPKAEFIPGGLTDNDYLLDDYNKGLNQWLYDGGKAIKCHNNINQRGLGAHGGQAGNLWIGPMAHVDDKPELIAAELATHMGLEYDLSRVAAAYPDISTEQEAGSKKPLLLKDRVRYSAVQFSEGGSKAVPVKNPLNGIRYLSGQEDFMEYPMYLNGQPTTFIPAYQLRDICANEFGDPDFLSIMRESSRELAEAVQDALAAADKPILGRIHYLGLNGKVRESRNFYDFDEMRKEISDCFDIGQPVDVVWNIEPPARRLRDMNWFDLEEHFYFNLNMDQELAADLASALQTPADQHTVEHAMALVSFLRDADPDTREELKEILGEAYLQRLDPNVPAKPGLNSIIQRAEQTLQNSDNEPQSPGKTPSGR